MKSISYSAARKEAELVFNRFTSNEEDDVDSSRFRVDKRGNNKKNFLNRLRNSFGRNTSRNNKENDFEKITTKKGDVSNEDSKYRRGNHDHDRNVPKIFKIKGNTRSQRGSLTFWIIPPPPPPPPPVYLERDEDSKRSPYVAYPSSLPNHSDSREGYSSSPAFARLSVHLNPLPKIESDGAVNGDVPMVQAVDNEDDYDDVDGIDDKFEDVSTEEQQRRVEEVAKMMERIVEKEFGFDANSNALKRSSSSTSISGLTQSLTSDLSYSSFKNQLSNFIHTHNDKILKQISLMFFIARSAIKKVGENSSRGQEIKNNAMRFYDEQFVPQVSKVGGLDGLMQSSADKES